MELRQLKYFMEVARVEHMTKASENLHVAQSAVSRQITKLEEELGVHLFDRVGRNMQLTSVGQDFLKQAAIALNELQKAEALVTEYTDPQKELFASAYRTPCLPKCCHPLFRPFGKNIRKLPTSLWKAPMKNLPRCS